MRDDIWKVMNSSCSHPGSLLENPPNHFTKDKSRIPANVVDWVKERSICWKNVGKHRHSVHIPIMTGWWLVACPIFPFRDVWYSFARSSKLVMATARARLKGSLMRTRGGVWKLGGISLSVAKHSAGSGCRKPMGAGEFPNCHPHLGVEGFGTKEGAYEQINALNTRFKEADSASQRRPIDLLLSDTFFLFHPCLERWIGILRF